RPVPAPPDIAVYVQALAARLLDARLERTRLANPFVLRSVAPPLEAAVGRTVRGFRRLGKRIVVELDDGLFLVFHLMIAGRLHWRPPGAKLGGRIALAAFDFADGTLLVTEAGTRKRASLHVARGRAALAAHDPRGVEV